MTGIDPLGALPARVEGVEVQDPILTMFGEGWAMTIACPWEGVRKLGPAVAFEFSSGTLIVTPDTDVDPWVLQLPGGLVVGGKA
ncbi:hypothetical protein [Cellulomonas bogoriensis]|uniref:Uncharacterized protein n=1 Tax=Cellulomonas bogoriensis 69B4 = DSM 16987 TaxID=1386082 RepID=A0A0A0C1I3_9CELL|nr:hypothetical protein [Cellulomonas bogoriensis]KGM13802.1 hypothetical protein N869_09570 [Cellulomonas bogoriensis 69B4 = DSM 16987]